MNMFKIPKFMLNDVIEVERLEKIVSDDEIYSAAETYSTRFEPYKEKITDSNGEAVQIRARVFMNEIIKFPIGSRVTFQGDIYYIWRIDLRKAIKSYSHQEIILRCR